MDQGKNRDELAIGVIAVIGIILFLILFGMGLNS